MLKSYDLALNTIEDKMIKRENVYLNDKELMAYWKARKNVMKEDAREEEFEWKFFDMIDEFIYPHAQGDLTDDEFVNLIQGIVDKRHNMKKICPDLHEEPASPVVKHETVEATPAMFDFIKKNSLKRDAQSISKVIESGLNNEDEWKLLTIIFDGTFKFDDSPRYHLHILADDKAGYLLNPSLSEGSMFLTYPSLDTVFLESEIKSLQSKLSHINLTACMELAE